MPRKIDEDATTGNKLLRLFRKLMFTHSKLYVADLARELNCSRQTVTRLLNEIENVMGSQLQSGLDSNRKWYQYSHDGLPVPGLEMEELRLLSVCRDLADPYISDEIRDRLDRFIIDTTVALLGDDGFARDYQKILAPDYRFSSKGTLDYTPHAATIATLENAIRNGTILKITYSSQNSSAVKEIIFAPRRFVCQSGTLYVIGSSLTGDMSAIEKLRSLAVHRISRLEDTGQKCQLPQPDADLGDFGLPWSSRLCTFVITFRPSSAVAYVKERMWCSTQEFRDLPDGGLELTLKTKSGPEVISWCRGFGDCVTSVTINGQKVANIMSNDIFRQM